MIRQGIHAFNGKRVLLLQGPAGPFFRRLSEDLTSAGAKVFKVNFNGGDYVFYSTGAINFSGRMEEWPAYFEDLLDRLNIDVVLLFGDCRPVHLAAREIAWRCGVEIGVFEEGYVRPNYVTFERYGVNGHSRISRIPSFFLKDTKYRVVPPLSLGNTFWHTAFWVCLYYIFASLLQPLFRHYKHHRPLTVLEALPWLRSAWRKVYYLVKERGVEAQLTGPFSKNFFLVPLQVHNDAQIHIHSHFDTVAQFIGDVVVSFANHAPKNTVLVIKHHPMDRAYFDYTQYIRQLTAKYGLRGRCFYIHDQRLPPLLQRARGVVVVNSTVGLSALYHGASVKVCGKALYDMKGLTFQGSLAQFWTEAPRSGPNRELFERFRNYLIQHTQLNGSFYKRLPIPVMATGLRWTVERARPAHAGAVKEPGVLINIDRKRTQAGIGKSSA